MRPLLGAARRRGRRCSACVCADRVGKGIAGAPRDAMIADSARAAERGLAFGFHRAMDHAGAVIGPLLGYFILSRIAENKNAPAAGDYQTLFLIASVPALAAVLVAAFFVRETRRDKNGAAFAGASATPPARLSLRGFDANFKRFLLILVLFTLSNSSDAFLLLRAQEAGVGAATIPLLWAALHVCKVASSLLGGDLSDRLGRKTLIASGLALLRGSLSRASPSSPSVGEAWALFLVYGIYFGLVEGAEKALVADLVPDRTARHGLRSLQPRLQHRGAPGLAPPRRAVAVARRDHGLRHERGHRHALGGVARAAGQAAPDGFAAGLKLLTALRRGRYTRTDRNVSRSKSAAAVNDGPRPRRPFFVLLKSVTSTMKSRARDFRKKNHADERPLYQLRAH